jgi:RimJ/RimL family protein N-acetyltransferase
MTSSATEAVRFDRAPTIETERLRLRAQRAEDLDFMVAYWARPEVYRHIAGQPRPREEVWRRMLANAGSWAMLGFGSWRVDVRATEDFAGTMGFLSAEREMSTPFAPCEIEIGWALAPEAQGKGYALEALTAMLAWSDANLPGRTIVCIIDPENAASLKLGGRLGFRERGRAIYNNKEVIQFERRPGGMRHG